MPPTTQSKYHEFVDINRKGNAYAIHWHEKSTASEACSDKDNAPKNIQPWRRRDDHPSSSTLHRRTDASTPAKHTKNSCGIRVKRLINCSPINNHIADRRFCQAEHEVRSAGSERRHALPSFYETLVFFRNTTWTARTKEIVTEKGRGVEEDPPTISSLLVCSPRSEILPSPVGVGCQVNMYPDLQKVVCA